MVYLVAPVGNPIAVGHTVSLIQRLIRHVAWSEYRKVAQHRQKANDGVGDEVRQKVHLKTISSSSFSYNLKHLLDFQVVIVGDG